MVLSIHVDPDWPNCFPGARVGLLEAHGLEALANHPRLEEARLALEAELRQSYGSLARNELRDLPALRVFGAHYRPYGRTYHVLQQLESVAVKGRPIPSRICAVTALFMAELKHGLVAAGHDLACVVPPLCLAPSRPGERYTNLAGADITIPEGDMTLRHARGLLSTVLGGPERGTPIGPDTRDALFTVYAPAGVPGAALEAELEDLSTYLACFSPAAVLGWSIHPQETGPALPHCG
ncbi:MAG TPA: hypothetical protein VN436_11030 [Holophaga sp.]|nr:hypothetical protein [Holophaga sp.]